MTVEKKLGVGIGTLLILFLILGIVSYFQTRQINKSLTEITDVEEPAHKAAIKMDINLTGTGLGLLGYLRNHDPKYIERIEKNRDDFEKYQNMYRQLVKSKKSKELGVKVDKGYAKFKRIAEELRNTEDFQTQKTELLLKNLEQMDKILDEKIQAFIKPDKPQAYKKLEAAMKMEININEIAEILGNYSRTHEARYEQQIHKDEEHFSQFMEIYKGLNLSSQEKQWAQQLHHFFDDSVKLIKEIIALSQKKEENLVKSVEVSRELEAVLNDEIQVLTHRNLENAEKAGHKAVSTAGTVTLILVLTGFIVGFVFSVAIAHSIANPIKKLKDATVEIGKGRLETEIKIEANDEIGQLASCFKEMTKNLMRTTTSMDNLNREAAERKKAEVKLQEKLVELANAQEATLNMADDIEHANQALGQEIAERKKAEQLQAQLLEQLEKTNQELKNFAYIVSHDLKAPLRGIKTITEWISTDYANKLDDDGKEQLDLLVGRVDRMHNLIDGILQYSRAGRTEEEKVVVNLNELVSETIDMIAPPENISITVENELPTIKCEQTRIMQVFQNLLSNAVKYMDKPQGQVKISCIEENDFWKLSVADNGPGIEEKYFEKIFQIFQTLLPRDEVEATGIGLSVVKKIVEMYEGSIWVESEVGKGSTFFFTLPKTLSVTNNKKQLLASSY